MLHKTLSALVGTAALAGLIWIGLPTPTEATLATGPAPADTPQAAVPPAPPPDPLPAPPAPPAVDPVDAWLAIGDEIAILAGASAGSEAERLAAVEALARLDTPMAHESLRAIAGDGAQLAAVRAAARAALPAPSPRPTAEPQPRPEPTVDASRQGIEAWAADWLHAADDAARREAALALALRARRGEREAVARAVADVLAFETWAAHEPWAGGVLVPLPGPWEEADARRVRTSLALWRDHCGQRGDHGCQAQIDAALAVL